jgi:hypothetical protein
LTHPAPNDPGEVGRCLLALPNQRTMPICSSTGRLILTAL